MPSSAPPPPAPEEEVLPLTEAERLEQEDARRSLRARLTHGPVLRAIGLTVSLGVISNFVLALLLTRPATANHGS